MNTIDVKKACHQPMRLKFMRDNNLEDNLINSVLKNAAHYNSFDGVKSYGIDLRKQFSPDELDLILKAFRREPGLDYSPKEILAVFKEEIKKHPEFTNAIQKIEATVEKHFSESSDAWKQHKDVANEYVSNVLGLAETELGEVTVKVTPGISSCQGPNLINYGGSTSNAENDNESAFRARNFVHEWLHCVEATNIIKEKNRASTVLASYAPHAAVFLFERYFYHKKIGGNIHDKPAFGKIDEQSGKHTAGEMGYWAHEMKYDIANFLASKGESIEDIVDFLHTQSIDIQPQEIIKKSDTGNFIEFRNKWQGIETKKTNNRKLNTEKK